MHKPNRSRPAASAALLLSLRHRPTSPVRSDRPAAAVRVIATRGKGSCRGRQPHYRIRFVSRDPAAIGLPRRQSSGLGRQDDRSAREAVTRGAVEQPGPAAAVGHLESGGITPRHGSYVADAVARCPAIGDEWDRQWRALRAEQKAGRGRRDAIWQRRRSPTWWPSPDRAGGTPTGERGP
jgi:hypothetical protein